MNRSMVRAALAALCLGAAGARAGALTLESATHLLLRTGFDAAPVEVQALLPLTRAQAVDLLLSGIRTEPRLALPGWAGDYLVPPRPDPKDPAAAKAARDEYDSEIRGRSQDLLRWWYAEMIGTDSPLTERLVLFWHGHFTSALDKVNVADLMLRQNLLLRRMAAGSFREMVHAIARDPAMLIYLDGQDNVKAHPNENFARELMELFTLGEGNYTEQDVRETARAFTGWRVDHATGRALYDPRRHDDGPKTILGNTGNWDGDDAIDIILDQPEAPRFIVTELWRELVSPDPDPREVAALAAHFREDDYQLRPLLRSLLTSEAFWSSSTRGTMVKSPVELAVGTARLLGLDPSAAGQVADAVRPMGEQLFNPPTVKGWPSGDAWLTSATLLAREAAVRRVPGPVLASAEASLDGEARGIGSLGAMPEERRLDAILLPIQPTRPVPAGMSAKPGEILRRILMNPIYQLM